MTVHINYRIVHLLVFSIMNGIQSVKENVPH